MASLPRLWTFQKRLTGHCVKQGTVLMDFQSDVQGSDYEYNKTFEECLPRSIF